MAVLPEHCQWPTIDVNKSEYGRQEILLVRIFVHNKRIAVAAVAFAVVAFAAAAVAVAVAVTFCCCCYW